MTNEKELQKELQDMFKKHEATYKVIDDGFVVLVWREPGTMTSMINYIIHGATLMVYGDHYEAIYRWSLPISFQFLAGCELGYFHEKCCASPEGRQWRRWDEKKAIKDFKDYVKDRLREMTADEIRAWKTEWVDDYEACLSGMQEGSQFFWQMCLHDHDEFRREGLYDDDYSLYTIGMPIDVQCIIHLVGIRLAVKQLEDRGVFKRDEKLTKVT